MYVRVLQDELQFPDDRAIDQDTKSLIRGVSFFSFSFVFLHFIEICFADYSLFSYCSVFLHFAYVNLGLNDILIFR